MSAVVVSIAPARPGMGDKIVLPTRMTEQAAGFDLAAAIDAPRTLAPGERLLIACGFCIELPPGFEAQIRSRSGLALRHGLFCLNSPGTIDADFRGEVHALLANFGNLPYRVEPGERVAQMVICRLPEVQLQITQHLSSTSRGAQGFGSTGREGSS